MKAIKPSNIQNVDFGNQKKFTLRALFGKFEHHGSDARNNIDDYGSDNPC